MTIIAPYGMEFRGILRRNMKKEGKPFRIHGSVKLFALLLVLAVFIAIIVLSPYKIRAYLTLGVIVLLIIASGVLILSNIGKKESEQGYAGVVNDIIREFFPLFTLLLLMIVFFILSFLGTTWGQ